MENTSDRQRNLFIAIGVLAAGLLASTFLWRAADSRELTRLQREVELVQERVGIEIITGMESRVLGLNRMVDRWETSRGTPYGEWLNDADNYRLDEAGYRAIDWVDTKNILQWASTEVDTSGIIGVDMSFEENRAAAMQRALLSGEATFTRPIDLVSGIKGMLVFVPIFLEPNQQFDGYILAVYSVQEIMDTLISDIGLLNVYVYDAGELIYARTIEDATEVETLAHEESFSFANLDWQVRVAPTQSWVSAERGSLPEIVLVVGSFSSLLLALFVHAALTSGTTARELQRSQQRLSATFEALPDLVFILDKELRYREILSADPAFLAVDASKLPGRKVTEVLPDEAARLVQQAVERTLAGQLADRVEYHVPTPRGEFWFEGRAAKLHPDDPDSDLVVWIARDVTSRVLTRQELARSNADLEQFAYLASHDLQEPLRKITTFSDRLDQQLPADINPRARDYLARMRSAAQRMSGLINDLLTFSRISADRPPLKAIALNNVVRNVLDDLAPAIEDSAAQIEVGDLPTIQGDEDQLRSLLQNLIGNAIKYRRPEAAPVVKIQAERLPAGQLQIAVVDNGMGFDEKYLGQIFLPFKRLHSRSEIAGSGIGLAICQKIVHNHGGTLTASSVEGEGSTFLVTLPER